MNNLNKKPIKRSKLRSFCGELYYSIRKYTEWYCSRKKYTKKKNFNNLDNIIFTHKTPLYRKLKDVDMWIQENKVVNLSLAIKFLDGIMIMPGECFSYWKLIGKPTAKKGYKPGMQIGSKGTVNASIGGGLCQLSNLIYWMTLHTPLTVIHRYRHSHDVFPDSDRTQPFGSGATCHFNFLDLEIKNETPYPYQLRVYLTNIDLVGEWRSVSSCDYRYEVYEKEHSMTPSGFGDYIRNNVINRRVFNLKNELILDEYITENHAYMVYDPYLPQSETFR